MLFSVPFEGDYPRIIQILMAGGLDLEPRKRKIPVLAGGVALWLNPRPLFPFLDGFILGELEAVGEPLLSAVLAGSPEKADLMKRLAQIPGFLTPEEGPFPAEIAKADTLGRPLVSHLRSPEAEFGECQLIEVTRGCGQSCRFCAAGYIYRPPRRPPREALLAALEELTPRIKVGLIGLEFLKAEEVIEFALALLDRGHRLSFSSIRLDALRPDLKPVFLHVKTLTLAPEAGSDRLRRILNKRLPRELILETARMLRSWPAKRLKLYFMFGLPMETEEDLQAIPELASQIKDLSKKEITVSLAPFVPKPWTPFQWAPLEDPRILKNKARKLQKALRSLGIRVSVESLRAAQIQALLARGGEELQGFIRDLASGKSLSQALKSLPYPPSQAFQGPPPDRALAWEEVVNPRVERAFLQEERQRAYAGLESPPCPSRKTCRICGACLALYGSS